MKLFYFQVIREDPLTDPCRPSPCGLNAQCRKVNNVAICSCLPNAIGSPPNCRPECVVDADCMLDKSCLSQKCRDPCLGTCGLDARCQVVNHSPICSCKNGFTGDPFIRCIFREEESKIENNNSSGSITAISYLQGIQLLKRIHVVHLLVVHTLSVVK